MTFLSIALQKSGRLSEDSLALLKECGISIPSGGAKLKTRASNFPLEILFLRDDDIPGYVADGVADLGIVGLNVLEEKGQPHQKIKALGFGSCRLSIAVPRGTDYTGLSWLQGKRIATSYPRITAQALEAVGVQADIHEISGSVEIAPGIGLSEAICDIVSSGSTLLANGLVEVDTILSSESWLVAAPQLSAEKAALLDKLRFRIEAVQKAKSHKYILLNAPNEALPHIIAQLPGMKSPTVLPLAQTGWSSLHSVINEEEFWERIEGLKAAGAEGILVVPIEKMIL